MKCWAIAIVAITISLLMMGCQPSPSPQGSTVTVSRIASGNTIEVLEAGGSTAFTRPVRLIGLTAPDVQQSPWGDTAKRQLETWLTGQTVMLELDQQTEDRYGRQLAYVWQDGKLVNEMLVAQGYALAEGRSPNLKYEARLLHAQQKARTLGLGIWNPDQPMRQTPDDFRQQQSSSETQ